MYALTIGVKETTVAEVSGRLVVLVTEIEIEYTQADQYVDVITGAKFLEPFGSLRYCVKVP